MRRHACTLVVLAMAIASLGGCRRGPLAGADAGGDAALPAGGTDASAGGSDAVPAPRDAASDVRACVPASCAGAPLACGDCADNDGDGLIDMDDSECTHPCDGSEDSLSVPGEPGDDTRVACRSDCFFDGNGGSGDDGCLASHRCDPMQVGPRFDPEGPDCSYRPDAGICAPQSETCRARCLPLTPNGCDCFGCCELARGTGRYVWLNSTDARGFSCNTIADADDPDRCRPCTPVPECLNTCDACERCIGERALPAGCSAPAP
jgi:hypothetical protein